MLDRLKIFKEILESLEILSNEYDFSAAKANCRYSTFIQVEGYWEPSFVNHEVYQKAVGFSKLSLEARNELHRMITTADIIQTAEYKGPITPDHRYPIPEVTNWDQKDSFLLILRTLQSMCANIEYLKTDEDMQSFIQSLDSTKDYP